MEKIEKNIDLNFYDLEVLNKSIEDFREIIGIKILSLNLHLAKVEITFNKSEKNNVMEFFNYLSDLNVIKKLDYE